MKENQKPMCQIQLGNLKQKSCEWNKQDENNRVIARAVAQKKNTIDFATCIPGFAITSREE